VLELITDHGSCLGPRPAALAAQRLPSMLCLLRVVEEAELPSLYGFSGLKSGGGVHF
jgi:hypothetical protein